MPPRPKTPDADPPLSPAETNPNQGSERGESMLADSIRRYKIGRPILADRHGRIIAGNHVYAAAQDAGLARTIRYVHTTGDELVVHVRDDLDLSTDPAAMELSVADNRTSEVGLVWDPDALAQFEEAGADLTPFWSAEEEAALFGPPDGADGDPDDDDDRPDPSVPTESEAEALAHRWQTRRGQDWIIPSIAHPGRFHRLAIGDATDPDDVRRAFPDGARATLLLTDPPYGVGYIGKTSDALTIGDVDDDARTQAFIRDTLTVTAPHLTPGAAYYICSPSGITETAFRLGIRDAGIAFRQQLVWIKHHFVLGHHDYHWRHETILYGWFPGGAHYFVPDRTQDTVILDESIDPEDLSKSELVTIVRELTRTEPTTVWMEDRPSASTLHPTIKPTRLFRKAIRNSTRPGALIYDPFVGSGTTILAAEGTARLATTIELSPIYAAVTLERARAIGLEPALA